MRVSWSILLLLLFFPSSVRAEEYSDSGNWGPDAQIEPEAEEAPKEAVKEKEEEERKEEPKAEAKEEKPPEKTPEPAPSKPAPPSPSSDPAGYEQEWEDVEYDIFDEIIPFEKRIALLKKFIVAHPGDHPHKKEAEYYLSQMEQHKETGYYFELNTTEWFGIRNMGGSHGIGGVFSFFTLRWGLPYLTIFRVAFAFGGGNWNWNGKGAAFLLGGTQFGLQFPLDNRNAHLIRVGTGLMMGPWMEFRPPDYADDPFGNSPLTFGPIWDFEVSYSRRILKRFMFEVGLELFVPTARASHREQLDWELPYPALMGFAGARF